MKEVFDLIADKIQEAYKVGYQAGYLAGSRVTKKYRLRSVTRSCLRMNAM